MRASCSRRVTPSSQGASQSRMRRPAPRRARSGHAACDSVRERGAHEGRRAPAARASRAPRAALRCRAARTPTSIAARAGCAGICGSGCSSSSSSSSMTRSAVRSPPARASSTRRCRRCTSSAAKCWSISARPRGAARQDARIALAVIQVHRDDEFLAREPLRAREMRAAAVRQRVTTLPRRAAPADAVGIRERQQQPGRRRESRAGLAAAAGAPAAARSRARAARALERAALGPRAAPRPRSGSRRVRMSASARPRRAQQVALRQQRPRAAAASAVAPVRGHAAACAPGAGARASPRHLTPVRLMRPSASSAPSRRADRARCQGSRPRGGSSQRSSAASRAPQRRAPAPAAQDRPRESPAA